MYGHLNIISSAKIFSSKWCSRISFPLCSPFPLWPNIASLRCLLFALFIGTKSCCLAFSLTNFLTHWCCWTSNWDLIHVTLVWKMLTKQLLLISEDNARCHLHIVALFYCTHWFHRLLCCHPSLQARHCKTVSVHDHKLKMKGKSIHIFNGINQSSLHFCKAHIKLIAGRSSTLCLGRALFLWWTRPSYFVLLPQVSSFFTTYSTLHVLVQLCSPHNLQHIYTTCTSCLLPCCCSLQRVVAGDWLRRATRS